MTNGRNRREEQGIPGLPDGFKPVGVDKWAGLNATDPRSAVDDQEASWQENFLKIGNSIRSLWDVGTSVYTATGGKTIVYMFFYNIGQTNYAAIFLNDGTADQVQLSNAAIIHISSTPGTFFTAGGDRPACVQWGVSGILIVSTLTANAYWAWDGTLWPPGNATSPTWLNGGTATPMPTGVNGDAIETFQSRVWIFNSNNATGTVSAPSNGANFATSAGGLVFPSSDNFVKQGFHAIKQANGYLYPFGDSSIQIISNVQTSGSPATTTFNNANADPQVGTPWRDSVQPYGKAIIFANATGIYGLFGSTPEKLSAKVDGIFEKAILPVTGTNIPSGAASTIFGSFKVYLLLITITDPFTGNTRPAMVGWDGKSFFVASSNINLTFIATQQLNSQPSAWGTDGTNVYQLFNVASATLKKTFQSKLWAGTGFIVNKQALAFYTQAQDNSGQGYVLTSSIDTDIASGVVQVMGGGSFTWINNSGGVFTWKNNSNGAFTWGTLGGSIQVNNIDSVYGLLLGVTVNSTSPDFTLIALTMGYRDHTGLYGGRT